MSAGHLFLVKASNGLHASMAVGSLSCTDVYHKDFLIDQAKDYSCNHFIYYNCNLSMSI